MSDTKSLIGRQVYFKGSKAKLAKLYIHYLTPNKLYTIINISNGGNAIILNDDGHDAIIAVQESFKCSHLPKLAHWILKRKGKS